MNSNDGDEFPANPFRVGDAGGDPFAAAPSPHQPQQQFQQQPLPPQQQQQPQFQQQPMMQQQQQQMSGQMNTTNMPPTTGGTTTMDPTTPLSTPTSYWGMCMACFRIDSYRRYFDVDTIDIQKRMVAAMTHFHQPQYFREQVIGPEQQQQQQQQGGGQGPQLSMNGGLADVNNAASNNLKGPDLYGPVWITFVLILLVAVRTTVLFIYLDDSFICTVLLYVFVFSSNTY